MITVESDWEELCLTDGMPTQKKHTFSIGLYSDNVYILVQCQTERHVRLTFAALSR